MQSAGHEMPGGTLVTVPLPTTVTVSVRSWTKVAVTPRLAVIATVHAPLPVQSPLQAEKAQPAAGVGVSETEVPCT
ncbi:MAG: hypothetical protein F9K18_14380 [Thermoanaerobaculia bacterium]|nr:MAG: hypothetical protein F9K18_14380 [Thermoanaerobaculia bacterium]